MVKCTICGIKDRNKSMQYEDDPARKRGFLPVCNNCFQDNTDEELKDKLLESQDSVPRDLFQVMIVKQQIICYAMLYFGIERYKINEGSMEFDLYQLSCEIGDLWEKEGWLEQIIISDDMCSETICAKVSEYIRGVTPSMDEIRKSCGEPNIDDEYDMGKHSTTSHNFNDEEAGNE